MSTSWSCLPEPTLAKNAALDFGYFRLDEAWPVVVNDRRGFALKFRNINGETLTLPWVPIDLLQDPAGLYRLFIAAFGIWPVRTENLHLKQWDLQMRHALEQHVANLNLAEREAEEAERLAREQIEQAKRDEELAAWVADQEAKQAVDAARQKADEEEALRLREAAEAAEIERIEREREKKEREAAEWAESIRRGQEEYAAKKAAEAAEAEKQAKQSK
jgi:hypothetical protein